MPIHPLASVDAAAEIHPDAEIGPFCVVKGAVKLAAGVQLRSHASVFGRATIGAGTIVFPGATIGGDPQDLKFRGEDSEVIVGERCRIHECATVNKGTAGGGMKTVVGDECMLMAYSHVAHDCILGSNIVIGNATQLAGHIRIGDRVIIGGMTGAHHFVTIGEIAIIGAMCGIRYDIPPFMMAEGNPAEPRNVNVIGMRRAGIGEGAIEQVRAAFKIVYHDKAKPKSQGIAELRAAYGTGTDPVHRLADWLQTQLDTSVKGRMQESHRPPVVGGKPIDKSSESGRRKKA
jgi:UDP-N-acetylglucosamine acyltransferase